MRRLDTTLLGAGFLAAVSPAVAQDAPTSAVAVTLPRTTQFDLAAPGRVFRVEVHLPKTPRPATGYPFILVLDGDGFFPIAAAAADLAETSGRPGVAVVAVDYADQKVAERARVKDFSPPLTPERIDPLFTGAPTFGPADFGGAEAFRLFLRDTLLPTVQRRYRLDPGRATLFGHSLGGTFALQLLLRHPSMFAGYVLASPNVGFGRGIVWDVAGGFAAQLRARDAAPPRVLVTVGGAEQQRPLALPPGLPMEYFDRMFVSPRYVDAARDVPNRLRAAAGGAAIETCFAEVPGEEHLLSVPGSLARAVEFAAGRRCS